MDAALAVFAQKGFAEASNRDIARAAGVRSPGLIYHYFPSKLDLLREIVETRGRLGDILDDADWLFQQPPEVTLTRVGQFYVSLYQNPEARQLFRVVLGEATRSQEFAEAFGKIGPLRIVGFLIKYFETLMDRGVLQRIDPFTAARAFAGPFAALLIFGSVFDRDRQLPVDLERLVQNNVRIFLHGLAVKPS